MAKSCILPFRKRSKTLVEYVDHDLLFFQFGSDEDALIPVDVSLVDEIWMPDIEILNLKQVFFCNLDIF